ncbi:MAG TPA: 4-hydroxybenzoate octaprenyltransferase [Gammaproteobacteria bacterium]|nr:4-hydroxybenzoate octaprenyltransferase [Gammaproteobacteria bacterium]
MVQRTVKTWIERLPQAELQRLSPYIRLMRLDRPIGNFLLMWPMLWALWIAAEGVPPLAVLVVFLLGMLLMRAAGCVINDYADRDFDGHVKRTVARPLAQGEIPPRHALILFVGLCLVAFGLVLLLNRLTIYMSFAGAALAALYPFMKRHTYLPQLVLGAAFGWAVPMAFTAIAGATPPIAWLIFIAAVLWALIYDTQYAMVDRDDDLKIGVKSTAILFGEADRLIIGILQGLMLVCLLLIGQKAELSGIYYLTVAVAAGMFGYQQYLIRDRSREGCFKAFLNNNYLGGAVFAGVLLHYLWL